jgi:alkaline phosphatase
MLKKRLSTYAHTTVMIILSAVVLFSFSLPGSLAAATKLYQGKPAKYVFVFIGDGMGIPQRAAAQQFANKQLVIDSLPAQGITTTYAADRFITGSAASATAIACGQKTNIGMLGMAPDRRPVKTIAELAKGKGMKVGIVSSVSIDHATPAGFYAHVPSRNQYYDIEVALAESGFDFFGGGGLKDPTNKKKNATNFKGNAKELMQKNGYKIVTDRAAFMKLRPEDGKIVAWNQWLQDAEAMPYAMDMTKKDISLPEFTTKAIEMLDNPKGFFLMVEGGKIDWACHANDAAASIRNTLAFDKAVQQAVDFSGKHPKETLIVVTGDHECGGLTLGFAGTKYASNFDILGGQNVSFQKFTDEILGTYKEGCRGGCRFDAIKPIISKHFGLKFDGDPKADPMVLEPHQIKEIRVAFDRTSQGEKERSQNKETYLLYGEYDPLTVTLTHILNQKAGLAWTSYKHTGVPVSTSATGIGADIFNGYYDNTDIAKKVMSIMGVDASVHFAATAQALKVAAKN